MTEEIRPRRRFLQQAIALVPASTLASSVAVTQTAQASEAESGSAKKAYSPTYFTQDEWAFINAAVDHLIPADELGPGAIAAGVPEFIDRQMETPFGHGKLWYMQGPFHPDVDPTYGYQLNVPPRDMYRHGIASCNEYCQKQFGKAYANLDQATQVQVLRDLETGKIKFEKVPAKIFFSFLWSNTKEGFFADPQYGGNKGMVGWKMIGFPGARGEFMDWPAQGNVKYPYGPVSISGEKA